jgi:lipopolysaccharide biosynthesis protein
LDIIPILKDQRYIKVNDAPLLLIYRADMFEDLKQTIQVWKRICAEQGLPNLHVSMVQTFGAHNPLLFGCDSATEFPPHNPMASSDTESVEGLNPDFGGKIIDYKDYAARAVNTRKSKFLRFRGAMLNWDNTARRLAKATIYRNAEPEEYKKLLFSIVDFTSRMPKDQRLIFINAWNEWAEGTHLEPDKKYGDAYLKATLDSINMNC